MDRIKRDFHIPTHMADYAKQMRPSAMMECAQEIAQEGADALGFGNEATAKRNATWVLSRMHIIFEEPARWKETVRFETWHKALSGLLFLRDFEVFDMNERLVARITSSWLVMDVTERRLLRPDRLEGLVPTEPQCEGHAIETPAPKLTMPKGQDPEFIMDHTVHYSDVDFIGHANNTRYVEWAMDCLPEELTFSAPVKELTINYNAEIHRGETVSLYRIEKESGPDGRRRFMIEGRCNGHSSFIAEFAF